jgi:predicted nucleotidyltransferase
MIYRNPLTDILGSRSRVDLLRVLARTRAELTGSALARATGLDVKGCHGNLGILVRHGLVERRRAGTAILYRLDERHVLAERLLGPLFDAEAGLLEGYIAELLKAVRTPVVSAVLFGSAARGDEEPGSDVDLLLVVDDPGAASRLRKRLDRLAGDLARRYGNPPQGVILARADLLRRARRKDPFIAEVIQRGRVVAGKPLGELLRHVS